MKETMKKVLFWILVGIECVFCILELALAIVFRVLMFIPAALGLAAFAGCKSIAEHASFTDNLKSELTDLMMKNKELIVYIKGLFQED